MSIGYGAMFPVVAGADFYADQLNYLRTAISRRAAQVGATVTLPAVMADDEPVDTDDELFRTWLDAARTAIEVFIGNYCGYASGAFTAWTKATLLGYVHTTWAAACTPIDLADAANWYQYNTVTDNEFYIAYLNEVYYALECLCYHEVATVEKSKARQFKSGTGQDGDEGGDPLADGTETVNSDTQSGSFGAAVATGTASVGFANLDYSVWWSGHDDGAGGWVTDSSNGCSFVSGSINYATGEWSVTTDFTFPAGGTLNTSAASAAADGDPGVALGAAWADFGAASYGADGASWEARGHLHIIAPEPPAHIWTAVVENYKVTDAQATVPDLAYADTVLYFPYQWVYMPSSPSPTLAVGTLVGQVENPAYHYHGWLKVTGDFDDEDVQLGAYYFDITSSNFVFGGAPPFDEACTFEVSPTGAYGRCGFGGGYINGEYIPI